MKMTSETNFSNKTLISAISDQLFTEVRQELVILDLKSGNYYGLNPVGAFIWQFIQEKRTVQEIMAAIVDEFDVDEATCSQDLSDILRALKERGLIEVRHEKA